MGCSRYSIYVKWGVIYSVCFEVLMFSPIIACGHCFDDTINDVRLLREVIRKDIVT